MSVNDPNVTDPASLKTPEVQHLLMKALAEANRLDAHHNAKVKAAKRAKARQAKKARRQNRK